MALNKQNIDIAFVGGINTKVDEKQLDLGQFKLLENIVFTTIRKFRKRNGYDNVSRKSVSGTDISNLKSITKFKDELCVLTDSKFYSRSSSINKWTEKGDIYNIFAESTTVLQTNINHISVDGAESENVQVFVYQETSTSGDIKVSIIDSETGNFLLSNQQVTSTGQLPRVAAVGNEVFIVYIDGTNLKYRKINLLSPTTIETEATIVSDIHASDKVFDIVALDNKIVGFYENTTSEIGFFSLSSTGAVSGTGSIGGESCSNGLCVSIDSDFRVLVAYSDGTDVKTTVRNFTLLSAIVAPTSIETIAATNPVISQAASGYQVFYEITAASTSDHYIKKNTIDLTATVGTPSVLARSLGIASKNFLQEGKVYVTAIHDSTLQSTYFIIDEDGNVSCKFSPGVGGEVITSGVVPRVTIMDNSKVLIPSFKKGRLVEENNTFFGLLGINSVVLDFNLEDPYQNERLGDNLHISGGYVHMYDGFQMVEHGFHLYPETLTAGSTATTGGSISDGQYQYAAVYSWTDNFGNIHRSAPSTPLTVTLSGGTSTQTQTIAIPTLRLTNKENVILELYRTEAAGTIFYKVSSTTSPTLNDKTSNSLNIVDTTSDTDLINNEILYTTGGVLENIAAPVSSIIESFQSRIFLAGLEDKNSIQYSKIRFENTPVEFNDTLTIAMNSFGGDINALKTMDDKLIVFKTDAIYYIAGSGPNNLGQQDTFIEPELISSDVGCIDRNSVVLTPNGLMFKSRKGIYLLGRNLQTQYIGAAVEDYNDLKVTSAKVIPKEDQVVMTTTDRALVYDFLVNQWTTYTNHAAQAATTLNSEYYYLRSDGNIYKQNKDTFSDNGSPIRMKIRTGWLSFAGMQGYKRVYKMMLLGNFKSDHKIRIKAGYNFNEAYTQESIIASSDFINATPYGGNSPYGSGSPFGGDGNVYQFRLDFQQQKCQSMRLEIDTIESSDDEGLEFKNMTFEVGGKQGVFKNSEGTSYGTD